VWAYSSTFIHVYFVQQPSFFSVLAEQQDLHSAFTAVSPQHDP